MNLGWLEQLYADYGLGLPLLAGAAVVLAGFAFSVALSVHALSKRHQRNTVAWLALIWTSPVIGWLSYVLLGINRVQRRAQRLSDRAPASVGPPLPDDADVAPQHEHLVRLARASGAITGKPLLAGNHFEPLRNGDEAYPAMLAAIHAAQTSVALLTYILDDDRAGEPVLDALIAAHRRGVAVRVLIDGIGARRASKGLRRLKRAGVPHRSFLWSWLPWKMALINLRNHRKLLVVDGETAFTGGINIRQAYLHRDNPGPLACDLHFRARGPIVRELQRQFALDWAFEGGDTLSGPTWFPELLPVGSSLARVLPDGPDEDLLKIQRVLFQAVTLAKSEVLVFTPYLLPDEALTAALEAAAQRGVDVRLVLPATNEPALMNPLTVEDLGPSLAHGVKLGFKQGPFEHTKLALVDGAWVLLGSSNWDPRSLRLNFELCVEVYDSELATQTREVMQPVLDAVRWVRPEDLDQRTRLAVLGTRVLRLFKPYL